MGVVGDASGKKVRFEEGESGEERASDGKRQREEDVDMGGGDLIAEMEELRRRLEVLERKEHWHCYRCRAVLPHGERKF